jgi:HAD superfamily hydrolase (TIGR01450 family)
MAYKDRKRIMELVASKDLFLLDGDGTLYLWDKAYNGSNLFIKKLKELKKNFIILSNNDSQSKENRLKLLSKELGIKFEENQLLLPNDIIEDFMLKKHIKRFDGLISEDLKKELSKKGFIADIKRPEIIIIGFDVDLNYKKLIRVITHINNGVKFILTHSDPLCPYKNKQEIPDAGLMVNMVSEATKKTPSNKFGKPYKATINYIIKKYGCNRGNMLIIGDRINTDIKMAVENDISSIWITGGKRTNPVNYYPTESVSSIGELYNIIKMM